MTKEAAFGYALLTPGEMAKADEATIAAGLPGIVLMEAAARRIADAAVERFGAAMRIAFLAGPGNNGGDAFAAARLMSQRGRRVTVFALGPVDALTGDARIAAGAYRGEVRSLADFDPEGFDLIVDGLFGAGLARAITGTARAAIERANDSKIPVLAIDLPSGVSGESGKILGTAIRATATVTFFLAKPGHWLEPGRSQTGDLLVRQIGIEADVLDRIRPSIFKNEPSLWMAQARWPADAGHKYDRGHAVVFSGGASKTGAARMAAMAALRAGAGLVTVFSPSSAVMINAAHLTAIMLKRCEDGDELGRLLEDERFNAFVLGPGFGTGEKAKDYAGRVLDAGRFLVLDADGISSFAEGPDALFARAAASRRSEDVSQRRVNLVLTPHAGEFKRLFPDLAADETLSKLDRARRAAERASAVVVLKGRDTVIAAPNGRAAISATGTPWLATAGSGDVLTGIVAAQLAQGTPAFEAACAAVWMHGRAAEAFGPGLVAEDLPQAIPQVLRQLAEWRR